MELFNHELVEQPNYEWIKYELRPAKRPDLSPVEKLHNAWIFLNNPTQFNSYTTQMVKEVILALRRASVDRSVNCIIFTAVGDKAFCTGGNTKEYAEYYAGNPQEYMQYMRLFNDMVTTLLMVDKPVICRVNGMRIAGGQEIGMACDFTIASDMARFGQAGPKHGSAPVGGSTDFLDLFVGVERGMYSGVMCETWTAYQALQLGLITEAVPVLKVNGKFVPNPLVITDQWLDQGRVVYGLPKTGDALAEGKTALKSGEVDLQPLDDAVETHAGKLLMTFPNCTLMTIQQIRKKKLLWWQQNCESNRQWLGQNMMTEARAGFRAFNEGTKETGRDVDFIGLRQALADGEPWTEDLRLRVAPMCKADDQGKR
jgi:6-oxo-cyclohex-1-ene-carbonyl-CoA hydrolase